MWSSIILSCGVEVTRLQSATRRYIVARLRSDTLGHANATRWRDCFETRRSRAARRRAGLPRRDVLHRLRFVACRTSALSHLPTPTADDPVARLGEAPATSFLA